jgi:hypothetical protein
LIIGEYPEVWQAGPRLNNALKESGYNNVKMKAGLELTQATQGKTSGGDRK